jgi:hypothetical protein
MFDAPEGTNCTAFRNRSNTPLQALTTLNDPVFFENAQALGRRAMIDGPADNEARLAWMFASCLTRQPNVAERTILLDLLRDDSTADAHIGATVTTANGAADTGGSADETAAWATVARTILNLDEFVTRR